MGSIRDDYIEKLQWEIEIHEEHEQESKERIEMLEKELKALRTEYMGMKALHKGHWKPDIDEEYWYIDTSYFDNADDDGLNSVRKTVNAEHPMDLSRLITGNYFETQKQAKDVIGKAKVDEALKKFTMPYVKDMNQFMLGYDDGLFILEAPFQRTGDLLFETGEKAEEAIEEVGEERITEFYFIKNE